MVTPGTTAQVEELLTKYKQTDLDFGINKDVFKELVGDAVDDATAAAALAAFSAAGLKDEANGVRSNDVERRFLPLLPSSASPS